MSYEAEQARLLKLWADVESDPEYDDAEEEGELDLVEERESSDTEQEFEEIEDVADATLGISGPTFIGKDKITEWAKHVPNRRVRTRRENLVTNLPGVKGPIKYLKTPEEIWSCFFDKDMFQTIVDHTNKKINTVSERYSRERDTKPTNVVEIKALFGLLYLAGIRHANHLNSNDLWKINATGI